MLPVRDDLWGWFHEPSGGFLSAAFVEKFYGACVYREGQRPAGLIPLFEVSRQQKQGYVRVWVKREDLGLIAPLETVDE